MLSPNGTSSKRRPQHVPVARASHVYKSMRADGSWVYEVRYPINAEGKRPYETVGKSLAEAKARANEVHAVSAPRVVSVSTTFSQVVEDWKQNRVMRPRSAATFDTLLRVHIEPKLGRRKVRDITPLVLQGLLAGLERQDGRPGELSQNTKRLILSTIDVVLGHGVEMGVLGRVPKLPRKRRPKTGENRRRVVSPDEEARLIAYSAPTPWLRDIITVTLHQALRLGEVCGLQWKDVDFTGGQLWVRHSMDKDGVLGPPKGGKAVSIPLTPVAREVLLDLWGKRGGDGFVFRNGLGGPQRPRYVQRAYVKAVGRAALPVTEEGGVTFHALRHSGISRLANDPRIPLVHVRDFARHSSLVVTQGYVHKIEDEKITTAMGEALRGVAV